MSEDKELLPYQKRVVEEHRQLTVNARALSAWLDSRAVPSDLPAEQRLLMMHQLNAMELLAEILARRIALF